MDQPEELAVRAGAEVVNALLLAAATVAEAQVVVQEGATVEVPRAAAKAVPFRWAA